jgi:hypothetical protein
MLRKIQLFSVIKYSANKHRVIVVSFCFKTEIPEFEYRPVRWPISEFIHGSFGTKILLAGSF